MSERPLWFQSPLLLNLALLVFAIGGFLLFGNPLEIQEREWFDQCLRWRLAQGFARPVDERIIHLDITESDLAELPTTESEYEAAARLIREAAELGVELVVFDVIYSRGLPPMAQPILEAVQGGSGVVFAEGLNATPGSSIRSQRTRSFPFLESSLKPSGFINIEADRDGVYRHYAFLQSGTEGLEPSLALATFLALKGIRWPDDITFRGPDTVLWQELSKEGTRLEEKKFTYSEKNPPLLDFRSGWNATGPAAFGHLTLNELNELHLHSVKEGGGQPLAGKIVFVSYVLSGVSDFGATPFGSHEPLVQLHSTALNDLLQNSFHWRVPLWMDLLLLASVLLMGLGSMICRTKRSLAAFWLLGIGAVLVTGVGLIFKTRWVVSSIAVVTLWTLSLVAELVRRHSYELVERLKLRTTVGYYFSPRVLERVLAHPGSMEPQQVELTVLLTDLRNFTPISERVGTQGVFTLCNQVFEIETAAVMEEDGSLEHFLGDQFLSYWGAPDPQPDGADRALRAATRLVVRMEELRQKLSPEVRELFGYGVALHAGLAMIGNKGSKQRLDYGVMGDLINSSARVEALTKYYGIPFLMTREAYNKLSNRPPSRLIDFALPVGKSTPFELREIKNPLSSPHFEEIAQNYNAAFEQYRRGDFASARQTFETLAQQYGDVPSRLLAERCEELRIHSPKNWAGVYKFTTK